MSTNALRIPDDHVAFCVLIPTQSVVSARQALEAAGVAVAEDMTVEADVVFWANHGEPHPFHLPLRYPPDPAPALPGRDAPDEELIAAAASLLDWAETMPDCQERRAALVALYQRLADRVRGGDKPRLISIGMLDVLRRLMSQMTDA